MTDTRFNILTAALRLFARDGYEAVSVSQIASALGMTKGALYKHYKSKRDIFDHIFSYICQLDIERSRQVGVPEAEFAEAPQAFPYTSAESLNDYMRAQFSYWTENEIACNFRRMVTLEQYRSPDMMEFYQKVMAGGPLAFIEDIFRETMKQGRRIHIMAKLTPDATRTEHGLVINEKIIPWGAVWPKDSGAYKKGAQYKADRLLSGGTGKVKGVTIHNTNDLKNVEEDAEQYTRATWPNANMNDARVHYYVDDINAWQNLREDEVGWHAGDGRKATGGNETTLSIEIIMDGTGSKEDRKAEENGVLLAALLLKKHGLSVNELYTHNHWMGHPDSIVQGARKNCPLYILPHWAQFKQKVAAKLAELNGGATTTETGKTEIMGKAKASAQQMALFARSKNAEPQLPACSLEQLAQFFLEEGEAEGVRGDVAFAQSLHETGFFKYGGIVLPTQNNYAGIGALNGNAKGQAATFPDPRTGIRAQIQHLKAYASKETLVNGCVDPRFSLVTRGSAQYVEWLGASDNPNGKGWAVPGKGYGGKIVALLGQIMAFEVPQPSAPSEPEEQEPEFPAYQLEGLETLTEAGVINSPEFWRQKFSEQVTVGEMFGILGKLFTKVTE